MENVPAMSGINKEREAARNMKDVLGEASCKTDVLANIVPQLRNGNGAEALQDKNCEPAKIDGCNASVIETTYAPYPGLRGAHNNEESAALRKNMNETGIICEALDSEASNLSGGAAEAANADADGDNQSQSQTNAEGRIKALQKTGDGNKGSRSQNESQSQSQKREPEA